ncbi:hypothetical protein PTTG_07615 [Puccinia triticina 1-1 BBBD Race 1]|uniref:CTLH domain-containing protein n=1 Tax=Puccinia triticina (isolate 1-1 / race 1 (BBBD)) TaxID=630390 RepID=A0A180G638_PUCT1|nr:hypothetical protein PTTG_07615 [Puccinia triticina 1-1 BBBD Race 1]
MDGDEDRDVGGLGGGGAVRAGSDERLAAASVVGSPGRRGPSAGPGHQRPAAHPLPPSSANTPLQTQDRSAASLHPLPTASHPSTTAHHPRPPPPPPPSTLEQPSHQRPSADSQRPSKRPRYSPRSMHSPDIHPAEPPNDDDDDAPRHRSSHPAAPPKNLTQDFHSLLKTFSDGLRALAPHLISPPPPPPPPPEAAPDSHQSLNADSLSLDHPTLSHPLPHPLHPPWPLISDIDREEIVRLLLQSLKEIGYPAAAMTLEVESGFSLDPSPEITSFRQNVLNGKWREVDALLLREYLRYSDQSDHAPINPSPLSPVFNKHDSCDSRIAQSLFGVDAHVLKLARFLVIQEKYLELLESRQIRKALVVLRSEIAPLVTPPSQNGSASSTQKPKSPPSGIGLPFTNKLPSSPANAALAGWSTTQDEDPGVQRLCLLSSLMMCGTSEEVRERAEWDGVACGSRVKLLEELQELIPPQKLLPHQRLPHLLEQSKTLQRLQCLYHVTNPPISLLSNHTCSRSAFPTETSHVLSRHTDEVWRIEWSHDGRRLASADRAKTCIIWKLVPSAKSSAASNGDSARHNTRSSRLSGPSSPDKKPSSRRPHPATPHNDDFEFEVELVLDRHPAGIACIAWSPDDSVLLTGADSTITMWNTTTGQCIATMVKHAYDVAALSWLPDGRSFVSGGLDALVLFWDLKGQNTYKWQVGPTRITDLAVSPDGKRLVVIGTALVDASSADQQQAHQDLPGFPANASDSPSRLAASNHHDHHPRAPNEPGSSSTEHRKQSRIHIFNIPDKTQIGMIPLSSELTTCVSISDDSKYALINQAPNQLLLYALEEQKLIRRYVGQKQNTHIIQSCFGGLDRNFILSGSEDGQIYVWHMETGALIEVLGGHGPGSVNAVAWNAAHHPPIFASASDDHSVRIWQAPSPRRPAPPVHTRPSQPADAENARIPDATIFLAHAPDPPPTTLPRPAPAPPPPRPPARPHTLPPPPPPVPAPASAPRLHPRTVARRRATADEHFFGGEDEFDPEDDDDEEDGDGVEQRGSGGLGALGGRGPDDHEIIY